MDKKGKSVQDIFVELQNKFDEVKQLILNNIPDSAKDDVTTVTSNTSLSQSLDDMAKSFNTWWDAVSVPNSEKPNWPEDVKHPFEDETQIDYGPAVPGTEPIEVEIETEPAPIAVNPPAPVKEDEDPVYDPTMDPEPVVAEPSKGKKKAK